MKTEDAAKRWLEALGPAGERASFRLLAPIIESPRPDERREPLLDGRAGVKLPS
ncbi:hypothetical protein WMF11_18070 [Sorangium sp. So ce295]|uniref:hypothetical protein n=1 Tax=Sorangium sp. So ce295 TaxID=3133295 RepID=UPI003F60C2E2